MEQIKENYNREVSQPMQNNNTNTSICNNPVETKAVVNPDQDYATLLEGYGLNYITAGFYWQVGAMSQVQGWIINLSVITIQIEDLLRKIIPVLLQENTSFQIAKNLETARNILYGNLGYQEMGKVINIYPDNDGKALGLSKKLVELTQSFKGPAIPTDIYLGGTVYVRYGAFEPIILPGANGVEEE